MTQCTVCRSSALVTVLSLGEQPASNHFIAPGSGAEQRFPLSLGYCKDCATIQLTERMPVEAVRPPYEWLSYNEPESHLDDVARRIAELPGVDPHARVLGVTYKDASTVARLARLGFARGDCIAADDLRSPVSPFGLETIQAILSDVEVVVRLKAAYGAADVLIVRHIVEHAVDASGFIGALRTLLAPGAFLILELPDSARMIRSGNHAFLWEEHISYFTASSLRRLASEVGAEMVWLERYPYPYEDSLVAVLRFDDHAHPAAEPDVIAQDLDRFAASLTTSRAAWRQRLEELRAAGDRVAVFGAGHLAAKFINFLRLGDLLDCVVDDHPGKQGMLMPGSQLPIVSSAELARRGIRVCISTLSPESEAKVRTKLAGFFDNGGRFIAAFVTT